MKKLFIPIIVTALLAAIIGGYYWWQKHQTIIPETGKVSCETLKDIPSVDYAPENMKQRFSECFPERAASSNPATPTPGTTSAPTTQEQGPTCDELKAIPSAQHAPPDVRDKFLKCFPERK